MRRLARGALGRAFYACRTRDNPGRRMPYPANYNDGGVLTFNMRAILSPLL
jgi:hypothetical protein